MINQQVVDYLLINNGFDAAFLNKQLNQLSKRGLILRIYIYKIQLVNHG